jgi:hypothetical protein
MGSDHGEEAYREIVEGRNGRPSLLVRMERSEVQIEALARVLKWMAYVATAILIAMIIGVGGMMLEAFILGKRGG